MVCPAAASADDCRLTYGIYDDYMPYEWLENGNPRGINVDLFKALAREAQCSYEIVAQPWPKMLDMLAAGELSMLSASLTPERLERFMQLPPDFVQYRVLIGRKGSPFISDLEKLNGKMVLVLDKSVAHESIVKAVPDVRLRLYESELGALRALLSGQGDYAMIDDTAIVAGEKLISGLTVSSQPMFPTLYGFMLRKDDPMYARLNAAAERLKDSGAYYSTILWGKNYKSVYLFRLSLAAFGVLGLLLFFIFVWNKSLQVKVRQKTKGLNEEIARHVQTEKALRAKTGENENLLALLQAILRSIPELVYIVDQQAKVLWHNRSDKSKFEVTLIREDLAGLGDEFKSEEFSANDALGNVWKILALDFIYDGEKSVLLFVSDITENLRLRDELFMTSRYSALGEMAALVAHEINNPLGCIMHNFDFLWQQIPEQGEADLNDDVEAARDSLLAALNRIKRMIDDLRGYTMRQTKEYESVDLRECVKSAVGITGFLINRCTGNFMLRAEQSAFTHGNYGQIEQMIINVLQNACYALTHKFQSITCTVDSIPGYSRVIIAYEGVGMDENALKNACKPYFTTRRDSGGTGLGLSMISRLIKEHGGFMDICSEPGCGTKVTLNFPEI